MQFENPGRLEALLNIFSNGSEISSVAFGIALLLGAISLLLVGKWSLGGKVALSACGLMFYGLAVPNVVATLVSVLPRITYQWDSMLLVITIIGLVILAAELIVALFLPSIIAYKTNKPKFRLVLTYNLVAFMLPPFWIVALFIAFSTEQTISGSIEQPQT
jgi:hypothetical protein